MLDSEIKIFPGISEIAIVFSESHIAKIQNTNQTEFKVTFFDDCSVSQIANTFWISFDSVSWFTGLSEIVESESEPKISERWIGFDITEKVELFVGNSDISKIEVIFNFLISLKSSFQEEFVL